MAENKSDSSLDSEAVEYLSSCFLKFAELLSNLPSSYTDKKLDDIIFLPWSIAHNSKAIYFLGKNNFGNEVFILLRALLEKIITFHYLQICDEDEYKNYIKYSKQKSIWKMNRSIRAGEKGFSFEMKGDFDINDYPDLKEAKDQFTSSKGRPLTRWSPTSIEKKLVAIEKAGVIDVEHLLLATLSFYDDGSEALHATMYGCMFHLGILVPEPSPKSYDDISSRHYASLSTVFFVMSLLLGQLLTYILEKETYEDIEVETKKITNDLITFMRSKLEV
jgi:hypothetical protein